MVALALLIAITEGLRMASDKSFIEFIVDQMEDAGLISYKKMFGEYAIYCDGKVVALVCDNQLFVKQPKAAGLIWVILLKQHHILAPGCIFS
jgi:hypothetical protein